MRYAQIRKMDISNGLGVGVALFTQGCSLHCLNCHNSSIWDFNGGKEFTAEEIEKILKLLKPDYVTRFSILGGEPLESCNLLKLSILVGLVKSYYPNIKIWCYTGYIYEDLLQKDQQDQMRFLSYIFDNIDVLVDGPFIEEQKDISLKFRGSANQRVIDLKETKKQGRIILLKI